MQSSIRITDSKNSITTESLAESLTKTKEEVDLIKESVESLRKKIESNDQKTRKFKTNLDVFSFFTKINSKKIHDLEQGTRILAHNLNQVAYRSLSLQSASTTNPMHTGYPHYGRFIQQQPYPEHYNRQQQTSNPPQIYLPPPMQSDF